MRLNKSTAVTLQGVPSKGLRHKLNQIIMNAPKYINILKQADIKFFIDGLSIIIDNEDGSFLNITDYTEEQFFEFLGF